MPSARRKCSFLKAHLPVALRSSYDIAYPHLVRRLGLWAVLCVEGKPTVYFKRVERKDLQQENAWQRLLWNHGTATLLVVEDSHEVRVYSGLARPEHKPAISEDDVRLVAVFDRVANAFELADFIRSIETGQLYRDRSTKFRSERAIDTYLLDNLGEARDQLCDKKQIRRKTKLASHHS